MEKHQMPLRLKKQFELPVSLLLLVLIIIAQLMSSCGSFGKNAEARYDDLELQDALAGQAMIQNEVYASYETDTVLTVNLDDDSADDPAIWYNELNPSNSVIYGSNKLSGIHVYNLQGKELQYVKTGRINNIDVRSDVQWGDSKRTVLAGSNRTNKSVSLFLIDETTGHIAAQSDFEIALGDFKPYGFCLYSDAGHLYAFVNNKKGVVHQISIQYDAQQGLKTKKVRTLKLRSQVEGMVADDQTGQLYVGEEQVGIHVFSANPDADNRKFVLNGSTDENKMIRFDIEGLALMPPHYLVASSQGNFSYAIFDLKNNRYVSSFKIADKIVDGVEETDGLEILAKPLGDAFPNGILIIQDGFNTDGKTTRAQNYKFVDLRQVRKFVREK